MKPVITTSIYTQCLSGNQQAFSEIVKTFQTSIREIARKYINNVFDIDDVVQDTFLTAFERLSQLREPRFFSRWIYVIARNTAISHLRMKKEQLTLDQEIACCDTPEENERDRLRLLVRNAIRALSHVKREVVIQHYIRGRSYEETAKKMGISVITVRSRLQKARNKLREVVQIMSRISPQEFHLSNNDLKTIKQVIRFTKVEDRYPAFQGILFDTDGGIVATDGRRLVKRTLSSLRKITVPVLLGPWHNVDLIFKGEKAKLVISGEKATFDDVSIEPVEMAVMDAPFPKYETVIPDDKPICFIELESNVLQQAANALLEGCKSSKQARVKIELGPDMLSLQVTDDKQKMHTSVQISASGPEDMILSITVNLLYFISATEVLEPVETDKIRLSFYGSDCVLVFTVQNRPEDICLIMPIIAA